MNVVQNKRPTKRKPKKDLKTLLNFEVRQEANPEKIINTQKLSEISSSANNVSNCRESTVILALTEGRGQARGEVGISALDLESPVLILCQLSDSIHYTDAINKIQVLNPSKILLPDTIFDIQPVTKLVELIKENFPHIPIIPVQRRHFNDKSGLDQISSLCSRKSFNILQIISRKYYCLSAAGALLSYLKNVSLVNFAEKCLKVDYQTKGGMMIDTQTSTKLELLYSLNVDSRNAKKLSLYGLVNKCETTVGQRHLRANILEPSCDIDMISKRQEQIKLFIENEELESELKESLQKFRNVEKLLKVSYVASGNDIQKSLHTNIQLSLLLKNNFEAIRPLAAIIAKTASEAFEDSRMLLASPIFKDILSLINELVQQNIHENLMAQKQFQYLYAIKAGANETIDFLRKAYTETVARINAHVEALIQQQQNNLPIKLIYTPKLGYHLQLKNSALTKAPQGFEFIHRKGNNAYVTTPNLMAMNDKVRLIENDIIRISNTLFYEMLLKIAIEVDGIYCLIGIITDLDIAQSLAEIAMQENLCCPTFGKVLRLEEAYHPILQSCQNDNEIIKNNVIATPQYNFYLITGPNMSGKTIYIKMIAIIQILAQIGSFVPAKSAIVRMTDKIFSRLGFQDSLEQNASSFTVELRDMEYIYSNLTPNSLVIIDELCRSTDPQEGEVLCYAFSEKLLNFIGVSDDNYFKTTPENTEKRKSSNNNNSSISFEIRGSNLKLKDLVRPFIFMTTHFDELSKLSDSFNNAVNLHMVVLSKLVDNKMRLNFKYRIQPGPSTVKSYGIALANMTRFPTTLIDRAEELLPNICEQSLLNLIKTSANNSNISKRSNESLNKSINNTSAESYAAELTDLDREVIDLFSHVLLQLSTTDNKQGLATINEKVEDLVGAMSPNLRKLLIEASLEEIITIINLNNSVLRDESK